MTSLVMIMTSLVSPLVSRCWRCCQQTTDDRPESVHPGADKETHRPDDDQSAAEMKWDELRWLLGELTWNAAVDRCPRDRERDKRPVRRRASSVARCTTCHALRHTRAVVYTQAQKKTHINALNATPPHAVDGSKTRASVVQPSSECFCSEAANVFVAVSAPSAHFHFQHPAIVFYAVFQKKAMTLGIHGP